MRTEVPYSFGMNVLKRSTGHSAVAAAAYRAGEKLHDDRREITHDYRRRSGVERVEILAPAGAPSWVFDRETLWNQVEKSEKRKDAQVCRSVRMMIPRELPPEARIKLVREFVEHAFVSKGMIADIAWHNGVASDGGEQPHAHILLSMRPLKEDGSFAKKSRHDYVLHPEGLAHEDGTPVRVIDNPESWNSVELLTQSRVGWQDRVNRALEDTGSAGRVDHRSYLERGIARMPEPALRMAWHMRDLYGGMKQRFGQYLAAKHFRQVEKAARDAFAKLEASHGRLGQNIQMAERFYNWFDRQIERLGAEPSHAPDIAPRGIER